MRRTARELNVEEMNMVNGSSLEIYSVRSYCEYEDCTASFYANGESYEEAGKIVDAAYKAHCKKYHKWAMLLEKFGLRTL